MTDDASLPPAEPTPEPVSPVGQASAPSTEPEVVASETLPEAVPKIESVGVDVPEGAGESPVEAPRSPATSSAPPASGNDTRLHRGWSADDRKAATAKRVHKKAAHLEAIVAHVREHKRTTNDEIVHKLHVSDATAARYTKILVERGALKMEGKGRGAVYALSS